MLEFTWPLLALHLAGAVGFVIVVSLSKIAKPIRTAIWPNVLGCPQCFGVWGGMGWVVLLCLRPSLGPSIARLHDMLAFAFAVSLFGFLISLRDVEIGAALNKNATKETDGH